MKLFKTSEGILIQDKSNVYLLRQSWEVVTNRRNLHGWIKEIVASLPVLVDSQFDELLNNSLQAPIGSNQELWAAGVTYLKSRDARMEESQTTGGANFYDLVYLAERPELFFKALPFRIAAHNGTVYIRKDSNWNVPEPELTVFINSLGEIQGYTIGNDMSSRSIEGENPLYLPQAKVYEKSAALGPCLLVPEHPLSRDTSISILIKRNGQTAFEGSVQVNKMKRSLVELASYLYRECVFPNGCLLMTGTGVVPPPTFTLLPDDDIDIAIDSIGVLRNKVAFAS